VTVNRSYRYSDRYHWLLVRAQLETVFQNDRRPELWATAIGKLEPFLRQNRMWPLPTGRDIDEWINEVSADSHLTPAQRVALLQNELVFSLRAAELSDRSDTLKATLLSLEAPILRIYRILDPLGQVPPFVLSDSDGNSMTHAEAAGWDEQKHFWNTKIHHPSYCESRGARLATRAEVLALGRAMTVNGRYQPHAIANISLFWSSTPAPSISHDNTRYAYSFEYRQGGAASTETTWFIPVRCVLPG
jgi:hypothetical protein